MSGKDDIKQNKYPKAIVFISLLDRRQHMVPLVQKGYEGISQPGHATKEKFMEAE